MAPQIENPATLAACGAPKNDLAGASITSDNTKPLGEKQALALDARPIGASVIVSEFSINRHECFRAEITMRDGKPIVALSRWKTTLAGTRRTGQAFEFSARHLSAVAKLLADAGTALDSIASQKGAPNNAPGFDSSYCREKT
jgi:hypothetical protein